MVANHTARPIRELISPETDVPLPRRQARNERRRSLRYDGRRIPGELRTQTTDIPVTCVDIGYAGIQVLAPVPIDLPNGHRVVVRLVQRTRRFEDEFTVCNTRITVEGTAIHLAL